MRRARVLLSARDPAAAAQLRVVIPALRASHRFTLTVAASEPALDILEVAGEAPVPFALPDGSSVLPSRAEPAPMLAAATSLLQRLDPDALVVGVSSLGAGIDEALLACAGDRPTFALQDYPGDANAIGSAYAGLYFVRDEPAAQLTRERFGVTARPVGSLRHARYAALDVAALRAASRTALGVTDARPVVGFFAQPAAIPGQAGAFGRLVSALAAEVPHALIVLREHPKSMEQAHTHLAALRRAGLDVRDASTDDTAEPALAACDVVTTCFSTTSMDYAFLSARAETPLGVVLFLLTEPATREFMRAEGVGDPDGVLAGLGLVAREPGEVGPLLAAALGAGTRRAYHEASRRLPARADIEAIVRLVGEAAEARVLRTAASG